MPAKRLSILRRTCSLMSLLLLFCARSGAPVCAAVGEAATNFTRGTAIARQFGTHEIVLTGNGAVTNPFDTVATVTFTPPSQESVTVYAFYDGDEVWRARVYVTEVGSWQWASTSTDDPALHNQRGTFTAVSSALRGMLKKHLLNPTHWMTDDGQWFLHLSDTAYFFLNDDQVHWREYVRDCAALGISSLRVDALRAPSRWHNYWADAQRTRYNLALFQHMDARLIWMLDHYPQMYIQLKLLPAPETYGTDDPFWVSLPPAVRQHTLRYMIARWAAFPQLFFEVTNDTRCSPSYPNNRAMAREVGSYFKAHDPWQHLLSYGPTRDEPFCFTAPEDDWVSYIAVETAYALSAEEVRRYAALPLHVFNEEDFYEHEPRPHLRPSYPRYFYRRLFWAWLLSGGSPNYGGRWGAIHPYTQTASLTWLVDGQTISGQLVGLDAIPFLVSYLTERDIELWRFRPDDGIVRDHAGERGSARPKVARRGNAEYLIYHPNAKAGELLGGGRGSVGALSRRNAQLDPAKTARLQVDLTTAPGPFQVEWFRARDGVVQPGGTIEGGDLRDFSAPWRGEDVVLRLIAAEDNPAVLENPRSGSSHSGIGLVCRERSVCN